MSQASFWFRQSFFGVLSSSLLSYHQMIYDHHMIIIIIQVAQESIHIIYIAKWDLDWLLRRIQFAFQLIQVEAYNFFN